MPEALAVAPEFFIEGADALAFAPEAFDIGATAFDAGIGLDAGLSAEAAAAGGLDLGLGATGLEGLGAEQTALTAAAAPDFATAEQLGSTAVSPTSSADLAPPTDLVNTAGQPVGLQSELAGGGNLATAQLQPVPGIDVTNLPPSPGGSIGFGGPEPPPGSFDVLTDPGSSPFTWGGNDTLPTGFTGNQPGVPVGSQGFGGPEPAPGSLGPPDIGMNQGTFAGTDQLTGGGVTDTGPGTGAGGGGTTVTTTTGKTGGGGLFGTGISPTQALAFGGIGLAELLGPGKLPTAGQTQQNSANQLISAGEQLQAAARANQISPAQQAQLTTIREQLIAQAYSQFARMGVGDPMNDSRFLQTVTNIDNQIAQQYQAFVNAEFQQGLADLTLAEQTLGGVLNAQIAQNQAFQQALFAAGLAASSLGGSGGGTTTTTTIQ